MIDKAVAERDDEYYERLEKISQKEGEIWEEMKKEVIAEMDADDLPLSKASAKQMVDSLDDRGLASILITMPWDDVTDFEHLAGVRAQISSSDTMDEKHLEAVIAQLAANLMRRSS